MFRSGNTLLLLRYLLSLYVLYVYYIHRFYLGMAKLRHFTNELRISIAIYNHATIETAVRELHQKKIGFTSTQPIGFHCQAMLERFRLKSLLENFDY